MTEKNYYAIDIMKFIAALFVIYMHISPLKHINDNLDYTLFSISRIAVPFFFITSGYLFSEKVKKNQENEQVLCNYLKRIFILYLAWSILMLPLSIRDLRNQGVIKGILIYLRNFIFDGSYAQLWYYPSLILGILLVFYFSKKISIKKILLISTVLYIIGLFGNSYYILVSNNSEIVYILSKYYYIFATTRNGFFYAFLFVSIGLFLSRYKSNISKSTNVLLLFISIILLIIESFKLKNNGAPRIFDTCIMLIPTGYLLVNLLINIEIPKRSIYKFFRNSSVIIFGVHHMLIRAFSYLLCKLGFTCGKPIVVFILTVIVAILFSIIVLRLENKKNIKVLRYLH